MRKVLSYAAIFIVLHLLVVLFINFIPIEQLSFPLKENPRDYDPFLLYPLAGFDGAHYILLAKSGYGQFQQAFFPLYPLLINIWSRLTNYSALLSGLVISWFALASGLIFFKKMIITIGEKNASLWSILFLLAFPSAFFYVALYPESLFLFLSSASLYYIFRKEYPAAGIFAILASLAKIQGVFLIIPFIISIAKEKTFSIKNLLLSFSPIYGLLIYSLYLARNYGDPLLFYHTQEKFGAERTSQGIILLPQVLFRYFKILVTSQINFQYLIAVLELTVFATVFAVLIFDLFKIIKNRTKNLDYLSINLYSITVLLLPTLTGTLSSIPRYALLSFGFFIALARIKNIVIKITIALIFSIVHIIIFIYFLKGYFVS